MVQTVKYLTIEQLYLFLLSVQINFQCVHCKFISTHFFQVGTCYSRRECRLKNGMAVAQCAQGYGVCCICKYIFHLSVTQI